MTTANNHRPISGTEGALYTEASMDNYRSFEAGGGCSTLHAVSLKVDVVMAVTAIVGSWFQIRILLNGVEWELVGIYCWSRDGVPNLNW